jgi:anti-sigma factor NepR-like protein
MELNLRRVVIRRRGVFSTYGGADHLENRTGGWRVLMGEKTTPEQPSDPGVDDSVVKKRVPDVKDHIARQLRALYDEVAGQPVPDRFMDLLNRLDEDSQDK